LVTRALRDLQDSPVQLANLEIKALAGQRALLDFVGKGADAGCRGFLVSRVRKANVALPAKQALQGKTGRTVFRETLVRTVFQGRMARTDCREKMD
jgi:hypothetical protein